MKTETAMFQPLSAGPGAVQCPRSDGYFPAPRPRPRGCPAPGPGCPAPSAGGARCSAYLHCSHGRGEVRQCGAGLGWNTATRQCDWAANVRCRYRLLL